MPFRSHFISLSLMRFRERYMGKEKSWPLTIDLLVSGTHWDGLVTGTSPTDSEVFVGLQPVCQEGGKRGGGYGTSFGAGAVATATPTSTRFAGSKPSINSRRKLENMVSSANTVVESILRLQYQIRHQLCFWIGCRKPNITPALPP